MYAHIGVVGYLSRSSWSEFVYEITRCMLDMENLVADNLVPPRSVGVCWSDEYSLE